MAPTVRLVRPFDGANVVAGGDFGRSVAARLKTHRPCWRVLGSVDQLNGPSSWWWDSGLLVLALWREYPALAVAVDDAAYTRRAAWVPVVLEHPYVRVGPLVIPGETSCYQCFRSRTAQHDPSAGLTDVLHSAYDANPALGPVGFTPSHVSMAAGLLLTLLEGPHVSRPGIPTSLVIRSHVVEQAFVAGHVVGVHSCIRCGIEQGAPKRSGQRLTQVPDRRRAL